ncbi:MAG: putative rRNA maturation factor [Parcubacteria group bacterium GW2011_GWA2_44_15]|nr:MAG: putative rRNA maturation factor [Parcubacteria group bacterium GW2011_GWA2_44_15]
MPPKPENNFAVTNTTKGKLPRLPFPSMKEAALGKKYDLSLVFASRSTLRKLNRVYRSIDKTTDILSFPIDKTRGEIFISQDEARKEAKKFDRDFENFIGFLFIHGLTHLKGYRHGSRMEGEEEKIRRKFQI